MSKLKLEKAEKRNEVKLKPCPFCGGRTYIASGLNNILYLDCDHEFNCLIQPNTWLCSSKPLEEQIKAWNGMTERSD